MRIARTMRRLELTRAAALVVLASACVSIPRAAPELSVQLAGRLQETRTAHLALLHSYMDAKRDAVDRFIEQTWLPRHAQNVFANDVIRAAWETAAASNDPSIRLEFIVGLGTRVQKQINEQRITMIAPLDETERTIARRLDDHYNQMLSMNATLTGLLAANASATETQSRIVAALDREGQLPGLLEQADQITTFVLSNADALKEREAEIKAMIDALRSPPP
ncbi:MAG: hypothetical protein M3373_02605 [Gemmatimonadota bacterium]|nr:hypothetical protein [Gemmatimonadota bacterium]